MQKAFDTRVKEILSPFENDGEHSREYMVLLQNLDSIHRKLRASEQYYQHAFEQITQLEQKLAACRTEWS